MIDDDSNTSQCTILNDNNGEKIKKSGNQCFIEFQGINSITIENITIENSIINTKRPLFLFSEIKSINLKKINIKNNKLGNYIFFKFLQSDNLIIQDILIE